MTILPPRIELLVRFYELTTNGTIIIFTSINSKLKATCQAEAFFFSLGNQTKIEGSSVFNIGVNGRWAIKQSSWEILNEQSYTGPLNVSG